MQHDELSLFLHAFNGIINGLKLYPPQHPANARFHTNLWQALQDVFADDSTVKIGIVDDTLYINDQLFADNPPAAKALLKLLDEYHIHGMEIFPELDALQLQTFVEMFNGGELNGELFDHQLDRVGIYAIRYAEAERDQEGSPARKAYDHAMKTISHICDDIQAGKVPQTGQVVNAVEKIARQMIKTPYAMLALSMLKDYDNYTFTHSVNVSVIALTLGRACQLDNETLQVLGVGSLLHDLGKLKIEPEIIKKPGKLSSTEYEMIKRHPELGAEIAAQMTDIDPRIISMILGHHLHYDRSGYPQGKLEEPLSPLVDMTTIADTFDAITSLRAYRRPSSPLQAVAIMNKLSGSHLHPEFMEQFRHALGEFPVGSLVRLVSNEIGLIVDMDALNLDKSTIRIVRDRHGKAVDTPYDLLLEQSSEAIASEVDPLRLNIDISTLM
jgi:putative nucleotidyltransferase with HDIG domain